MTEPLAEVDLSHPAVASRTGRGISVAIIDSGVNPWHDHIGGVAGGVGIEADGTVHDDFVDNLGHGTAVAAAIHEKAPEAELYAVRVFRRSLATTTDALVRAIDWAAGHGIRLANLSLGTRNSLRGLVLQGAVSRALEHGTLVVSAHQFDDEYWLPGSLPGAIGVLLDWDCPRDEVRVGLDSRRRPVVRASGYPRPIPGVPPERNLRGISFAVANATAFLALALQGRAGLVTAGEVFDMLCPSSNKA